MEAGTPGRLLVVDDEKTILELLSGSLRLAGFEVTTAVSGTEAVHAASSRRPDLVLLDVMMPDGDGFEALRRVREALPAGRSGFPALRRRPRAGRGCARGQAGRGRDRPDANRVPAAAVPDAERRPSRQQGPDPGSRLGRRPRPRRQRGRAVRQLPAAQD